MHDCTGSISLTGEFVCRLNAIVAKEIIEKKLCKKITYKCGKNNKCNKIQNLEREEAKKSPEMSANIAKVTRIFVTS